MICNGNFNKFITILSEEENTIAISQKAFSLVAEEYRIAQIEVFFSVGGTFFTPRGVAEHHILYQDGDFITGEADYTKIFHTGENGTAIFHLYRKEKDWSEEEKRELDTIIKIFFIHIGRYRLIYQAQKNAMTDFMTELPNADGYMRYVKELFHRKELAKYNSYYLNLKSFGLMNRKFGQKETDEIIKRYAKILKDYTDNEEIIGRLGGDNFVALIRKERTAEFLKLIAGVDTYGILAGEKIPIVVEAVAGVLEIEDSLEDYEPVISKCAVALNIARNVLKQPYVFATKELDNHVYMEKQLMMKFPQALEQGEFEVYYQPKVETDFYRIVGAEALVRWYHNGQAVNPENFIPVIERSGAICKLDFFVLEKVCKDINRWLQEGIEPVRISVNFSRKHLSNPGLANEILAVIDKYNVPIQYIEIEVTETVNEEEQGLLSKFVKELKQHQITTAIDDFGTGYSSLELLCSNSVDVLKIDKSFIDKEDLIESDEIVLTNIIRMAKELKMEVITEGVKNWKQVKFLHDIDCRLVQGFLFDSPLPEDEFKHKMQKKYYDVNIE